MKVWVAAFGLIIPICMVIIGLIIARAGADIGGCEECDGHPCHCYDTTPNYFVAGFGILFMCAGLWFILLLIFSKVDKQ